MLRLPSGGARGTSAAAPDATHPGEPASRAALARAGTRSAAHGATGEVIRVAKWVIVSNDGGPAAILIAGPTASGKSALAVEVARDLGGVVVNADSMQVYRDLPIITAWPSLSEMARVPHALYGTIDGAVNHSVQRWLADVQATLHAAATTGLVPVIVGGTGLYFKALTQGLSDVPSVPDEVRAEVRAWACKLSAAAMHAELMRRDPATAQRLRPTDPQRLTRALEVHVATGRGLAAYHEARGSPLLDVAQCVAVTLKVDRDTLRERTDQRFDAMIAHGALEEIATLRRRCLNPGLPIMRAHGVVPLLRVLDGTMDLTAAVALGKSDTRSYVKRQDTYFRHQLQPFMPLTPADAAEAIKRRVPPGRRQL